MIRSSLMYIIILFIIVKGKGDTINKIILYIKNMFY